MEKKKKDDTATLTAEACNVSPAYVRMVVNGKRSNERILSTYHNILNGKQNLVLENQITPESN